MLLVDVAQSSARAVGRLADTARQTADGALRAATSRAGHRRRRAWSNEEHAFVEVRGLNGPDAGRIAPRVESALARLEGVRWATVLPSVGRVAIAFEDGTDLEDLIDTIGDVEDRLGAGSEDFPLLPHHPGDREPFVREAAAAGADAIAMPLAIGGLLTGIVRLPAELAGLVSFVDNQPRLRHLIEAVAGKTPTDFGFAVANAVSQGLAQGALGLAVDLGHRVNLLSELQTQRDAWEEHAADLMSAPPKVAQPAGPFPNDLAPRPQPLPGGPVETFSDRAGIASAVALGAAMLATGSPRQATATMLAFTPKGASLGREAFAAHLGRILTERGTFVIDRTVLRRLDRIDTLLVDAAFVQTFNGTKSVPEAVHGVVSAAAAAGLRVITGSTDEALAAQLHADGQLHPGETLAAGVRRLQGEGAAVAAVTTDVSALLVADCGIGLADGDGVAHEADLLCPGLGDVAFMIETIGVAQEISRQSAAIAMAASSVGAALAVLSKPTEASRAALAAVNSGALAAMANGLRAGVALARHPTTLAAAPRPAWHELDIKEALSLLDSSAKGLDTDAVDARRPETPREERGTSLPAAVLEEIANPMTPVLAGAAVVSGAIGSVIDAGLVGLVVVANGTLGGWQRFRVERAVRSLEESHQTKVHTRRDGDWRVVAPEELVVGDVIRLEAGDWVPADCRIIKARAVEVEQAGLTGESAPVPKDPAPSVASALDERASMLYEGSSIAAGRVDAVVVAVAPDTEQRRAVEGVKAPSSGVENRLQDLTRLTIPVAIAGAGAVLASGLFRRSPIRQGAESAINLAVAAVPEGLPLLATMAQLSAARRLSARGSMVRNPRALEALGRVGVLCCDKTGTLTEGRIALQAVHDGVELQTMEDLDAVHRGVVAAAVRASPRRRAKGDPLPHLTDQAVVEGARSSGVAADDGVSTWEKMAELPFEPARGYHAVLGGTGESQLLSLKGAPEVLLPRCDRWCPGGREEPLDDETRTRLMDEVDRLGRRGYRLLAVAEREASSRSDLDDERVARLTFLGFVALIDPVRPTAAAAVADVQEAGISVVMLTGDHPSTAEGVAVDLGVLNGRRVLTGGELDDLSDAELDDALDGIGVFARVTPSHKTRLVAAYQRRGQAVAMTGDGANDAPAIRLADAGVALGLAATPAARASADLVVPNGRIETLVDAIVEGRALWTSVRDAISILVGGNLGEIGFTVVGSALTGKSPLNPRQLLLVNMLTDIAPAMVIATRRPRIATAQLLAEGPERSLGAPLERAIAARGLTTSAGAVTAWVGARLTGPGPRVSTISLIGLVGAQLCQTAKMGGTDRTVLAASFGSAAVLAAIIQTPGLSQFFGCTPLGPLGWGIGLSGAAAAGISSDWCDRLVARLPSLPNSFWAIGR